MAIASLMTNYQMQADTLALAARQAGEMVACYWGGAMIGRFVGGGVLRRFPPAAVLASVASAAIGLLALSGFTVGPAAGFALIAIGCCNTVMFPTILSLACEGLGPRAAEGSSIICVAIVGGAVVPENSIRPKR